MEEIASQEWLKGYNKALGDIVGKILENNKVKIDSEKWLKGYKKGQEHIVEDVFELTR